MKLRNPLALARGGCQKIIFEQDYISAAFIVAIMIVIDYLAKNRGKLKEFEIM